MRKRTKWIVVGIVLTIGLLCAAALVFSNGAKDARIYVNKTLPAIATNWEPEKLRYHLNRVKFTDQDVQKISEIGRSKLGKLESCTVNNATLSPRDIAGDATVFLCYAVPAAFEKKKAASVFIAVASIEGRWQIVEFDVSRDDGNNLFKPLPPSAFPKK